MNVGEGCDYGFVRLIHQSGAQSSGRCWPPCSTTRVVWCWSARRVTLALCHTEGMCHELSGCCS